MKKIRFILCSLLVLLVLAGCNAGLIGNYEFNYVHSLTTNECYRITKWIEDSTPGIEVKTVRYGNLFFSEGTYILVEDECPICGKGE